MTHPGEAEAIWLQESAATMGLLLNDRDAATLIRYVDLLARWNGVYNLTAVRDRTAMRTQHLLDCLAIVEPFRRMTSGLSPQLPKRILDVGSGGGLPGVVMAVLLPDWSVVCVDTVGKRRRSYGKSLPELAVHNLQAAHSRVETLREPAFGVVTARAFSSLSRLAGLTARHLAPSGLYLAMKGKAPLDEMEELGREATTTVVFHVEPLTIPGLNAERCIVWMRNPADASGR